MATNSIFNNIKVTDQKFCETLVNAIESKPKKCKPIEYSRGVSKMDAETIKKVLSKECLVNNMA